MADYTAIIEAGKALVELLRDKISPEPVENREANSLCSPHENGNNQLTIYLYHIEEQSASDAAGYYQVSRDVQRVRSAEFALHYLITAHSKAPVQLREADQQRIIGSVIQTLRDNPVIPRRYLTGSSEESGAELHVVVDRTPLEQMLKIWNDTSKEYKLSITATLTGVSIDSSVEKRVARVTDVTIDTEIKKSGDQ